VKEGEGKSGVGKKNNNPRVGNHSLEEPYLKGGKEDEPEQIEKYAIERATCKREVKVAIAS